MFAGIAMGECHTIFDMHLFATAVNVLNVILVACFPQRVTAQLHLSFTWIAIMATRSNVFKKSWKSVDQGQQLFSNGHVLNYARMPNFIYACHMWAGWVLLDITIDVILVSKKAGTHGILHENGVFLQRLRKGNMVHETWSMPQESQNETGQDPKKPKGAKKAMKAKKTNAAHKKPAAKKSKK